METKERISEFLHTEESNSRDSHLEIIETTNNLVVLGEYSLWNNEHDDEIREAAHARLKKSMTSILKEIDDPLKLVEIYDEMYWKISKYAGKIRYRLREVLANYKSVEEFYPILKSGKLSEKDWCDENPPLNNFFYKKLIELVKHDRRNTDFKFLLMHQMMLNHALDPGTGIEDLMPHALKHENDHRILNAYMGGSAETPDLTTHNEWSGYDNKTTKFVAKKILEIIIQKIPKVSSVDELKDLCWYLTYELRSTDKNTLIIDKQLSKFISSELGILDVFTDFMQTFKRMQLPHREICQLPKSLQIYNDWTNSFLKDNMHSQTTFAEYKKWIKFLKKEEYAFGDQYKMVIDYVVQLSKDNVGSSFNLEHIVYFYQISKKDFFKNLIEARIAAEEKPENLTRFNPQHKSDIKSEFQYQFWDSARKRILELIDNMRIPNDFFLSCIQNKNFFGNKELFIKKAREFEKQSS